MRKDNIFIENEEAKVRIHREGGDVHFALYKRQRQLEGMSIYDNSRVWMGALGFVPVVQYKDRIEQLAKKRTCKMNWERYTISISISDSGLVKSITLDDKTQGTYAASHPFLAEYPEKHLTLERLSEIL